MNINNELFIVIFINSERSELSCEINGNSVYILGIRKNVHSGPCKCATCKHLADWLRIKGRCKYYVAM